MPDSPIDRVVARLTDIVDWARADASRIGYFAAMYRTVTLGVKAAIEADAFEDSDRMTGLMVVFAERYLDAFERFRAGTGPTEAWQASLEAASHRRPIIVQQLLTGMNAHINLDLAIAAATVCPGAELAPLQRDFYRINQLLGDMIDGFLEAVATVSPWIGFLDAFGGHTDQVLIRFSINRARDAAWTLAGQLAALDRSDWGTPIAARDHWTARFSQSILSPGWMLSTGLLLIRVRESNNVRRVIDVLAGE